VRHYTAPPLLPDSSDLARAQCALWADAKVGRLMVALRTYALRLGEVLTDQLRELGIGGSPPTRGWSPNAFANSATLPPQKPGDPRGFQPGW
jgi:hypothetical protein